MGASLPPVNLQYIAAPPATGVSLLDTANINAAIALAGNGGIVSFPPNQIYMIRNFAGSTTVIPAKLLGNGSTLKLDAVVYTTIAGGTVSTGTTSLAVANGAVFNVGDSIALTDGAGNFTNPTTITGISGNTLTVAAISLSAGTSLTTGATVLRNDRCLFFQWPAATNNLELEICNFILDGNSANRTIGQQWTNQQIMEFQGYAGYTSAIWAHHNVLQNGPCDGLAVNDVSYLKIQDNHCQNIWGSGTHPGGSGNTFDVIITGNSFNNVGQFTNATTPTIAIYGHVLGYGSMVTSNSPHRLIVANNSVDTSQGRGFDGLNANNNTDYVVSGNIFYNCTMGGFQVNGGKQGTFTGNLINSCGHDVPYITGAKEITAINTGATKVSVTGNTFIESPFVIAGDAAEIAVTGNSFTNLVNQYGANVVYAALFITYSTAGSAKIDVTGNSFRGPAVAAELTAVNNLPLNGIYLSSGLSININNNTITGYKFGIYAVTGASGLKNVRISGNVLQDQLNYAGGTNAHGILLSTTIMQNVKVCNNSIARLNDTTGGWTGIEQGVNPTTVNNVAIAGNQIASSVSPATSTVGMNLNSFGLAGFKIADNEFWLNPGAGCWAIYGGGSLVAGCWATNNIVHNSSLTGYGAATVATGNQAF